MSDIWLSPIVCQMAAAVKPVKAKSSRADILPIPKMMLIDIQRHCIVKLPIVAHRNIRPLRLRGLRHELDGVLTVQRIIRVQKKTYFPRAALTPAFLAMPSP